MLERVKALLRSPYFLIIAALVVLVAVLALLFWLGWLGPWLWVVVAVLVGVGIFAALRWGVPWLRERRFVGREGSEFVAAGEESPEEFRAKFAKALQMLKSLPQLKGTPDPVYALPWYLLIGPTQSGKTAALQGANLFSPLLPPSPDGGTQNCDWWVSNSAVVIDTAGRYAIPANAARDRSEWYRLLRLLHHHREHEPINGLLITVAADGLAAQPEEALRQQASQLRDRIEEAVRELGSDFPVYVVVTKCDVLEGFAEFFGRLPARVQGEVLGYVDDATSSAGGAPERGAAALHRLGAGLQTIYDRLHLFRLAVLDSQAPDEERRSVFCFPEEFKALGPPLMAFAEPLFSEDVRYHTPLLRGIFFTSAQQAGARVSRLRKQFNLGHEASPAPAGAKHYFLSDLFDAILARDRGLVSLTPREQRRRGLGRMAAVGGSAVVVLALAAVAVGAYTIDRRIVASIDPTSCPETPSKSAPGPQFDAVERCRQAVETVSDQNQQRPRWSTWIINRSQRLDARLRDSYVRQFRTAVLEPLNIEIDRAFDASSDPLPLMLLVAQRIHVSRRCGSPAGCSERTPDLDYALMANPGQDRRAPPNAVTDLQRDFSAYVLWQGGQKELLQQDLAGDQKRLQQWLSAKQFSLDTLVPLVNRRSPPTTYDAYWELPAPIGVAAPQIEAACTKKVWEQSVAPFLQQLQDAVPDAAPKLRAFEEAYRTACLAQWQRFLAAFATGAGRWKGTDRRRTIALRMLSAESPLSRVLDDAVTNLTPWIPAGGAPDATPAWAEHLRGFATSEQRKAYQDALGKISTRLEHGDASEVCLKLAQETFTEGKPSAESTNPVLRAWWIATQAEPGATDGQKRDDGVLRSLLEEPLRFVWRVILDGTGTYLQKAWAENVIAPLKGLPPAEQVVQLYGSGGRVGMFGEQFLRPFFSAEGKANTLLGATLPVSPQFLKTLNNAKELKPTLEGGSAPQPVNLVATRSSDIESRSGVVGGETIFSVTCSGRAYRITDRPQVHDEAVTTVPWSGQGCGDASIAISFFAGSGADPVALAGSKRMQLTKMYAGRAGFLQFLKDFTGGVHRFQMDDLSSTDPDALRSGVSAVAVYYRVDVPPGLTKLISAVQESGPPEDIVAPSSS